jgi:hypothetical protein
LRNKIINFFFKCKSWVAFMWNILYNVSKRLGGRLYESKRLYRDRWINRGVRRV